MLVLDGQLIKNSKEVAANRPLSDFVASLPRLARNPSLVERVQTQVDLIATELQRVQFELPAGFEQLLFHPLGLQGNSKSPIAGQIDRLLVVSPFVSEKRLHQLSQQGKRNILIARPEALEQIPLTTLGTFAQCYQISPAANPEDADATPSTSTQAPLVGLHAKLYVAEAGPTVRIWTGSANATDAAFERNVEFLVELVGSKQQFGIDTLLALHDHEVSFRSLLEPFIPPSEPILIDDSLQDLAQAAEVKLLKFSLTAHVLLIEASDLYCLQLQFEGNGSLDFAPDLAVRFSWTRRA
jgi:hypothetical protein